jgi:hypothetical protein
MRWSLLTVLLLAAPAAAETRPNIIFILADDLGYGDVHCLNPNGKIKTPHLDRLAAGGMIFTDAHSGSAVCSPTRYGILTQRPDQRWLRRVLRHQRLAGHAALRVYSQ